MTSTSNCTSINSAANSQYVKLPCNDNACYACGYIDTTNDTNETNDMANRSEDDDNIIRRLSDYHTLRNLLIDLRNEYTNNTASDTASISNKKEMIVLKATRDDLIKKIDKITNNINDSNITLTALNYRKMRYKSSS